MKEDKTLSKAFLGILRSFEGKFNKFLSARRSLGHCLLDGEEKNMIGSLLYQFITFK